MTHVKRPFLAMLWIMATVFLFNSCEGKQGTVIQSTAAQPTPEALMQQVLQQVNGPLSISEYLDFLKKLQGITYDEVSTAAFDLSLLYKPQVLEAAMSVDAQGLQKEDYIKLRQQQAGYHYLLVQYTDKQPSVSGIQLPKKEIIAALNKGLVVVKDGRDTIRYVVTEEVPSSVMGQPDHILLLVPATPEDKRLTVFLDAAVLNTRALVIDLYADQLNTFPEVKF